MSHNRSRTKRHTRSENAYLVSGQYERGKRNSSIAEEYAEKKYNLKIDQTAQIDDPKNRTELKSCQLTLRDYYDKSVLRKGIFKFRKEQHQTLLTQKGSYVFVLMIHSAILADIKIHAKVLEDKLIWDIYDEAFLPWDVIFNYKTIGKALKELTSFQAPHEEAFAKKMTRG
jgi:hypothetical protein